MPNDTHQSLANQFLIAMPGMLDPSFESTVTLVCEHTEAGAFGVVINRPTDLSFTEVLRQFDISPSDDATGRRVMAGGPVERQSGFVLHSMDGDWEATIEVSPSLRISFALDIVQQLADTAPDTPALFGLGYAGWGEGQLEHELLANAWLTVPVDRRLIFELPFEQRWAAAAELIGVDINRLASHAGHD